MSFYDAFIGRANGFGWRFFLFPIVKHFFDGLQDANDCLYHALVEPAKARELQAGSNVFVVSGGPCYLVGVFSASIIDCCTPFPSASFADCVIGSVAVLFAVATGPAGFTVVAHGRSF